MSAAAHSQAVPAPPDPPGAAPAAIGRVLSLVRRLIGYGRQLAATAQQRAAAPDFARFAWSFGTDDLAAILARITGALRRAAALESRLSLRAARGQDLAATCLRLPAHTPRTARQSAPSDAAARLRPAEATQDPRLARLPTEAEIAAEIRRRPVGAVIADICRDLGIAPGDLDRAFWDELSLAIIEFGGSLSGFIKDLNKRMFVFHAGERSDHADPPWTAPEPATGPP
jgi:hypothetical protein